MNTVEELFKRLTNQVLSTTGDKVSAESLAIIIIEYERIKKELKEVQ